MIASLLVSFYRFWHGRLGLQGAGLLLRLALPLIPELRRFPLRLPEGHFVEVDFADVSAMYWLNHLLGDRFEEEGLLMAVHWQMPERAVVWDVGANCGLFSYRLARDQKARKVVFFEPNPTMHRLAQAGTGPFKHVEGMAFALSDKAGMAEITVPAGSSTNGTLETVRTNRTGVATTIECRTGDEVVESGALEAPDLIKIDTEGHELAVIRGLQKIIELHRPIIFFEHLSLSDEEIGGLVPEGYGIHSVSDADGSLAAGFDRERGHNSALVPKRQ